MVRHEEVPARHEGRGRRAEVGEQQAAELLDGVGVDLHLLLEASVGVDGLLEGLLDALPGLVHHPAVVHAAEAVLLRDAVGEVDAAVRAEPIDEAERAGLVLVKDEVLAKEADGLGGPLIEFGGGSDGVPVAAHEFAHGRALADLGEVLVLLLRQHRYPRRGG